MAITAAAAAVEVVLPYYPPVLVCTWPMIRSSWISRLPDRSFAFSLHYIQTSCTLAPPHTCNTTNCFNTTPYPLAAICRFYGPSPLRLLPVLRACAEPQAGVSPPRRNPPHVLCDIVRRSRSIPLTSVLLFPLPSLASHANFWTSKIEEDDGLVEERPAAEFCDNAGQQWAIAIGNEATEDESAATISAKQVRAVASRSARLVACLACVC